MKFLAQDCKEVMYIICPGSLTIVGCSSGICNYCSFEMKYTCRTFVTSTLQMQKWYIHIHFTDKLACDFEQITKEEG